MPADFLLRRELRPDQTPRLAYRPHELARAVGCHPKTIKRWIASGRLKATKIDGCILIPAASVDALLRGGEQ